MLESGFKSYKFYQNSKKENFLPSFWRKVTFKSGFKSKQTFSTTKRAGRGYLNMEEANHMVSSRKEEQSDWLHQLTYIEKQCENGLEYIAHGEIQIIRLSFKTLLAIIGSCQGFLNRGIWLKCLWFRITNLTTMYRMT